LSKKTVGHLRICLRFSIQSAAAEIEQVGFGKDSMNKGRLEAFSDGVIAILITIMVFDIKAPAGSRWEDLQAVIPIVLPYVMSFLYLGAYWTNHHHVLQATSRINGSVLWANLHLLFWLSLFPFTTSWLHRGDFEQLPAALYGVVLFFAAIAYGILQATIMRAEGSSSRLRAAIGSDWKGKISQACYLLGIGLAFFLPRVSILIYATVAALWLVPDRRIESHIGAHHPAENR
jgi:uncharacterized membrane protein